MDSRIKLVSLTANTEMAKEIAKRLKIKVSESEVVHFADGEIMFQGDFSMLNAAENSLTAKYLIGKEKIQIPERRIYNPKSSS